MIWTTANPFCYFVYYILFDVFIVNAHIFCISSLFQTLNENYKLCLYFIQVPRVYIFFFCVSIYCKNISDDDDQLVLISYDQNQDKAWNCNVFQMWFFHFIYLNLIYVLLSKTVILLLCINICVCCDSQQMTIDRKQLKLSLVNNRNGYCIAFKLRQQLEYRGMSRMQYVMNQIWADECESTILVCFIYVPLKSLFAQIKRECIW